MNAQKHNEEKLNEAFAQKCGVYLIFSVNMSGHFQGYARMMSYVSRQQVRSSLLAVSQGPFRKGICTCTTHVCWEMCAMTGAGCRRV